MKKLLSPARGVIAAALIAGLAIPAQAQLRQALDVGEQATRRAEQVQNQINQLDDERTDMVREYRTLLQRRDAADLYAKQQELVVASQREEIVSLTEQLGSIDDITAQTVPMLLSMVEDLKTFVAADLLRDKGAGQGGMVDPVQHGFQQGAQRPAPAFAGFYRPRQQRAGIGQVFLQPALRHHQVQALVLGIHFHLVETGVVQEHELPRFDGEALATHQRLHRALA